MVGNEYLRALVVDNQVLRSLQLKLSQANYHWKLVLVDGIRDWNDFVVWELNLVIESDLAQQAVLLDAFADAIRSKASSFKTPGEMGLRDVRIIEAVYRSAAQNGVAVSL